MCKICKDLVASSEEVIELRWFDLEEDEDITDLLRTISKQSQGGILEVLFNGPTKLKSDHVEFNSDIFWTGNCEITQADKSISSTMFEFITPQNLYLSEGLTFVGSDNSKGMIKLESTNDTLLKVNSQNKTAKGGTVKCYSTFRDPISKAFGVFLEGGYDNCYDLVDIQGTYFNGGLSSNCSTKQLKIKVKATDPYSRAVGGTISSKVVAVEFGRTLEYYDVDITALYGGGGFAFRLDNAVGNINITAVKHGFLEDGTPLNLGHAAQLFKIDSQGTNSYPTITVQQIDCDDRPYKVSLEASPGPSNLGRMKLNGSSLISELSALQNDGQDNYENYGGELLEGSVCKIVRVGSCSYVNGSTINELYTIDSPLRNPNIKSSGSILSRTTIKDLIRVDSGSHLTFDCCKTPPKILVEGDDTTVLIFKDNEFYPETKLQVDSWENTLIGFNGKKNRYLDTSQIPASSIPYLLIDAVTDPRNQTGKVISTNSSQLRKILNPANGADGQMIRYSADRQSPTSTAEIKSIDKERCIGRWTYSNLFINPNRGSDIVDLGVSEGAIESSFRFIEGGLNNVGLAGRVNHDHDMVVARLIFDESNADNPIYQITYKEGKPHFGPTQIINLPKSDFNNKLVYDRDYKLRLELDDLNARIYLDDILVMNRPSEYLKTETKWAYKAILGSNQGDPKIGPEINYLIVKPISSNSNAISRNFDQIQSDRRNINNL